MASLDDRIAALQRRDRLLAIASTVAMWVVLVFVFLASAPSVPGPALLVVLGLAMLALGGLNTASALALIRRYRLARDQVYRPDIENLDAKRAARAGGAT
jgi:4-amino-4-deoxy-L-arabinose transferase-like glycosyltransferase